MTLGCDYAWERPDPRALFTAGYRFACRYLSYDTTGKNLSAAEAQALHTAGVSIVLNWEYDPQAALRGFIQGHDDAVAAAAQRTAVGAPNTVPVYFSVDFNATAAQMPEVLSYVAGCVSVLGYDGVGVYGSDAVIAAVANANACKWLWQTYAWSNGTWDSRAHIRQTRNGWAVAGWAIDQDESMTVDFGQWNPAGGTDMPLLLNIIDTDGKNYDVIVYGAQDWHYIPNGPALQEVAAALGPNGVARNVSRQLALDAYGVDLANHPTLGDVLAAVKAAQATATTGHITGTLTVGP